MNVYTVDGSSIRDMQSLGDAFAEAVSAPDGYFGSSMQTFDDCLFIAGFGMRSPCEIVWLHHRSSAQYLSAALLAEYCTNVLADEEMQSPDFAAGRQWAVDTLEMARLGKRTMFDEVVDMIRTVDERSSGNRKIALTLR